MVMKKTVSFEVEAIKNNSEYIQKYVDLLYLRAVVGGIIAIAVSDGLLAVVCYVWNL